MKLFDSHCHLDDKSFCRDIDVVINRAKDAGVDAVMIVGITEKSSSKAVELAETRPGIYASVGIHPHDASSFSEKALANLKELAVKPAVHAWGETGLDFNRMYSPRDDQELSFKRQIEAACELNLPLIFHERDSQGRFLEILNAYKNQIQKGVVHCFSGNREELKAYLDFGLYIGITGILTIKSRGEDLRRLVTMIPADQILVETDAPYLTPAPEKNKTRRHEPAFVRSTLLKLAEVRGEEPEHLAEETWNNACRLYNI
ncbi:MAG: TatD family hydrolase [Deltaproteobacteria bacterium]|nr:TatD family hydrolase [Deltaproteobacteria bacterium]